MSYNLFQHKDGIVYTSEAMTKAVKEGLLFWSDFQKVSVEWAVMHIKSVHHIRTSEDIKTKSI